MNTREEFEEWVGNTSWTPYQKSIMFLAWQEQQKKIDDLEQQMNEAVNIIKDINNFLVTVEREIEKDEDSCAGMCFSRFSEDYFYHVYGKIQDVLKSWEQIKAGKHE